MNVRNDRAAGAAPGPKPVSSSVPSATETASAAGTTGGAAPGSTEVQDLEELAQQSLVDASSSLAPPAPSRARQVAPQRASTPPMSAKTKDVGALQALLDVALAELKPGESVQLGGVASGAVGLSGELGVELEIERLDNGRYQVRMGREGSVGVGGKAGIGGEGVDAGASITLSQEASFEVATMDDAQALVSKVVGLAVAGSVVLTPAMGAELGLGAGIAMHREQLKGLRQGIGGELAGELELAVAQGLHLSADGAVAGELAVAFEPPDQCFLECEVLLEDSARLGEAEAALVQLGGEGERRVTVRVPLRGLEDYPAALLSEGGRARLLAATQENLTQATVKVELEDEAMGALGGFVLHAEKTVKGSDLASLMHAEGWELQVLVKVGPKIHAAIGPGEVEIGAHRTAVLFEHQGGSLDEERALARSKLAELEKRALREHPSWARVPRAGA